MRAEGDDRDHDVNNHRTAAGLAAAADVLRRCASTGLRCRCGQDRATAVIRYLGSVRSFDRIDIVGQGSACGGACHSMRLLRSCPASIFGLRPTPTAPESRRDRR
jgi:hypothetical protein